ncbi:MAG TPA: hypothetical protein VHU19_12800 [Pyrinomonadaceae bacterium]|jgi:hypothetical protein|nr:hypothetical protein [Pyrinomonadaceae bacterium]
MPTRPKAAFLVIACLGLLTRVAFAQVPPSTASSPKAFRHFEYLWYEAENMQGISVNARNEPRANPSWMELTRAQAPGFAMNGPGVSAEWSQGGESEWDSVAAAADETHAAIYQDIEVPRDGEYRVWARYADWANRTENFVVRITQQGSEVFRREFGARDRVDPHDEFEMYWGWAFTWDGSPAVSLKKGAARLSVEVERDAEARRHVDCVLVTNDLDFKPEGRRKPTFAAQRVLSEWNEKRPALAPLVEKESPSAPVPALWRRPKLAGRDFLLPWNISEKFWELYDQPAASRPLYPFNAEPVEAFIEKYKGARDVPLFSSPLVVPVVYINDLPKHLKEGSAFLRYLRETHSPFAVLINYGTATFNESEGQAALKLLTGELRPQFIGWISGESIGHVWPQVAAKLTLSPEMSRAQMLDAYHAAYTRALEEKWSATFHTPAGAMWNELIPAQSTSSTAYAHALASWGVRTLGMETSAVQPSTAMRVAFTRGAARQFGGDFLYYHAPNFGDTASTFTASQSFAGPDHFFHTRYGATLGPSLSWYRKNYYLYYMAGASAIYLEQGFDQFFKPGPGEHPFQLNPLGRITDEFIRFAEKHADRGTPYTPIAFLLDPAHGWDMTDWPHFPLGVAHLDRSDRALRELFLAAYYPAAIDEGEPATADRQAFTNAAFGDISDVLVASDKNAEAIEAYRALVVGGRVEWTPAWGERLKDYVRKGGTVVLNAAQVKGLPAELLGVRLLGSTAEADDANCLAPGETQTDLAGQVFRYERIEMAGAEALIKTPSGDAVVTVNRVGRGRVVFCSVPDLLGLDERLVPAAAHMLAHLLADATPVKVRGDVEYLVNRNERGWVVTLLNNRGVNKPQQGMAQVDRSKLEEVDILFSSGELKSASEWTTDAPLKTTRAGNDTSVSVEVPPGGVRIVELIPKP